MAFPFRRTVGVASFHFLLRRRLVPVSQRQGIDELHGFGVGIENPNWNLGAQGKANGKAAAAYTTRIDGSSALTLAYTRKKTGRTGQKISTEWCAFRTMGLGFGSARHGTVRRVLGGVLEIGSVTGTGLDPGVGRE